MSNALATSQAAVPIVAGEQLEGSPQFVAKTPEEMEVAQQGLIAFFEHKQRVATAEADEASENELAASQAGLKTAPFKRLARRLRRKAEYYAKAEAAVRRGDLLVPNLPIQTFAVRVVKDYPAWKQQWIRHTAETVQPAAAAEGEGRYVAPLAYTAKAREETRDDGRKDTYWAAEEFDEEIDFPLVKAKPVVLSQCTAAMQQKIYDEIGVVSEVAKGDPVVIGRIYDGSDASRGRCMTFVIAWYVDLRDL